MATILLPQEAMMQDKSVTDEDLLREIEGIAESAQCLSSALILISSHSGDDPRLSGAVEEIAQIIENKSEVIVDLIGKLSSGGARLVRTELLENLPGEKLFGLTGDSSTKP